MRKLLVALISAALVLGCSKDKPKDLPPAVKADPPKATQADPPREAAKKDSPAPAAVVKDKAAPAAKVEAKPKVDDAEPKVDDAKPPEAKVEPKKDAPKPVVADKTPDGDPAVFKEAKSLIDDTAKEMRQLLDEVKAAKGDKAKIQEIQEKFKTKNKAMKARGEAVAQRLTEDQKMQLKAYAEQRLMPIVQQLLPALLSAGGLQPGGAPPQPKPNP